MVKLTAKFFMLIGICSLLYILLDAAPDLKTQVGIEAFYKDCYAELLTTQNTPETQDRREQLGRLMRNCLIKITQDREKELKKQVEDSLVALSGSRARL